MAKDDEDVAEISSLSVDALTDVIKALRKCKPTERRNVLESAARFFDMKVRPRRG